MSVFRIWQHSRFEEAWKQADTSIMDDISASWFARREILLANSQEYQEFLTRLKRRHAIETGIVERMYDLDTGVTETLIQEGFLGALISHGDTNIEKNKLLQHLQDHLEAVDFVFDVVKENRPLTKGFILELHQLSTRNQDHAEGRDQFGNKTRIPLIKGRFKERENNPTRPDGTVVMYCPPEHVEAEMDRLIEIYEALVQDRIYPLIVAAWVHHAFTTIHPFQDGNGRVIRLLASLILVKANLFPITVLREEAKEKYITALEQADEGKPQPLVNYFAELQRRNIEEALNLRDVATTSLEEVTDIFQKRVKDRKNQASRQQEQMLAERRRQIFELCAAFLTKYKATLEEKFDDSVSIYLGSGSPDEWSKQHFYYQQIVQYAIQHHYFFNRHLPRAYFVFGIDLKDGRKYEVGITIHHYGYDDSTIAIGAFLEYKGETDQEEAENVIPTGIKPHIISVNDEIAPKEKNIRLHLENILTIAIAQIASEI